MRGTIPDYELEAPASLDAVLAKLAESPGEWRPFAGGTDLMVLFECGVLEHKKFVSLWHLEELRGIEVEGDTVRIGALTSYSDIRRHEVLRREFPMLCEAAAVTGGPAIQNRGTIGGNIANASPAADTPPALLAYHAELEIVSARGERRRPYDGFHTGYKQMDLAPDELIRAVRIKRPGLDTHQKYFKVGTRKAQAISKVVFAGLISLRDGAVGSATLALGSVAPVTLRCVETERVLEQGKLDAAGIDAAVKALGEEIAPIDDIRSTGRYRKAIAKNLLRDWLTKLAKA